MTRNDLEHLRLFASFGKMIMEMNPTGKQKYVIWLYLK